MPPSKTFLTIRSIIEGYDGSRTEENVVMTDVAPLPVEIPKWGILQN